MADFVFAPLERAKAPTTTDLIFSSLYDSVIWLDLPPGAKLSEADVAQQFGVSRQPVRDAFFRLSKLGFLSIRPQRATTVTKISRQAIKDAVFVRTALEVECLREAAERLDDHGVARLQACLAEQKQAITSADQKAFHALDDAFHLAICEIAGHGHVWQQIHEQKAHMDRLRSLTLSSNRRAAVQQDHAAIVQGLIARDVAAAERIARAHLSDVLTTMQDLPADHQAYFEETFE